MIFKKKYVRSEWMKGLLEAEEFIKDSSFDSAYCYVHRHLMADNMVNCAFISGWWSCLKHYKDELEVIDENP